MIKIFLCRMFVYIVFVYNLVYIIYLLSSVFVYCTAGGAWPTRKRPKSKDSRAEASETKLPTPATVCTS